MKKMILSALTLWSFATFAQEEVPSMSAPEPSESSADSEKTWTRAGIISLLFNQTAFNHDWTGGGTNNYGGNLMTVSPLLLL